ncbi:hypothetical protein BRDID11002_54690 [Bradyrhizobium diazoefficiens]
MYNYVWTPQTDPDGIVHPTIDYPGVRVDHATIKKRENILASMKVPARLHFGTMALAPSEADFVSSIPPSYTGGNIDDWRIGKGARMFYPVAVPGAYFSVGDPHAAQGDSELGGTAIETSLTGDFEFILHKKADLAGTNLHKKAPIWKASTIRCSRPSRPGRSTASPIRTISPRSGPTHKPRSPITVVSTVRCAMRSASCAGS